MAKTKTLTFLKDVLICSLGAYGGPESHYGVFSQQLVEKRGYLSAEELSEYIALTSLLPGPSSTQTLMAIGYQVGGRRLALWTLLVWALPVVTLMTLMSFSQTWLTRLNLDAAGLRYLAPLAVAFIVVALINLVKKSWTSPLPVVLALVSFGLSLVFRMIWLLPLLMLLGGAVMMRSRRVSIAIPWRSLKPPWWVLGVFVFIALGTALITPWTDSLLLTLFDAFYRYGYFVIGGGQVLVPYMYTGLVETFGFLDSEAFMTGFGLVQGLPGPMFSFSAYAGGMAAVGEPPLVQVSAALLSAVGIFLPAVLMIYFFYPMWAQLKAHQNIRVALQGVVAVAIGIIAATAVRLFIALPSTWDTTLMVFLVTGLMLTKKVPAPLVVLGVILIGFIFV